MASPQVCVKALRAPVLAAALRAGQPPEALLARLGLGPDAIADPTLRLPHEVASSVWEKLAAIADEPCFGLFAAQVIGGAPLDFVDYALSNAASVRSMVAGFARWQRLFHEASEATSEESEDRVTFVHRFAGSLEVSRHLEEFILGTWVLKLRKATNHELPLERVELTHRPASDRRLYGAVFGDAELCFERPERRLTFLRSVLDLPVAGADPALGALFARQVDAALAARAGEEPFLERARTALLQLLPAGEADVERLAAALGTSPRTLHRRLAAQGLAFRELLDDVRERMARFELSRGAMTVTDLAFVLGYSDLSAFSRAFRRWTGMSPADYRQPRS